LAVHRLVVDAGAWLRKGALDVSPCIGGLGRWSVSLAILKITNVFLRCKNVVFEKSDNK